MAQQTKRASSRSAATTKKRSLAASTRKRASTNGRAPMSSKPGSGSRAKAAADESLASKLKVPAIATGAAAAGLVGGLIAGRSAKKPASQNLAEAAKQIGSFGERVGELASEIRTVREGVAGARNHKRSPIEVVLQGLTSRDR